MSSPIFETFPRTPYGHNCSASDEGLLSCTESLGFESFNETTSMDEAASVMYEKRIGDYDERPRERKRSSRRSETTTTSFPPPLTSLNENGQPSFVLRPMRKDGRLELTEVPIDRPEIICSSRENGRLTMCLVTTVDHLDNKDSDHDNEDEKDDEEQGSEVGDEGRGGGEEWRFPGPGRRCYEVASGPRWDQGPRPHHPCVTTR
ncbi:hypothetical protein Droror1_Dr00023054 [Drosera rotundifolia]